MKPKTKIRAWKGRKWYLTKLRIFRSQLRIYKTALFGKLSKVHWLQRELIRSEDARLLAVYIVTTNRGKNTPGVDQACRLDDQAKLDLANGLKLDGKASPTRRRYIPKSGGSDKRRPLGIPTMEDRAKQALAKLALEPQHEAYFEPNSYGFRPGRSALDAIAAIWISLAKAPGEKYVLDADIAQCFDRIDHHALLAKTRSYTAMNKQIEAWLKAGVMLDFNQAVQPTHRGTPQGGVISPLLANIALHDLENHLKKTIQTKNKTVISVIRYADDLVVLHQDQSIVMQCRDEIQTYLPTLGLELNMGKTTLKPASQGFNFLGFSIIKVRRNGKFKTLIRPSKASVLRHSKELQRVVRTNGSNFAYVLVQRLRPLVIGWCNYFRYCECSTTFSKLKNVVYHKLRAWMWRRSNQGRRRIKEKYMPFGRTYLFEDKPHKDNWTLVGRTKGKNGAMRYNFLPAHTWFGRKRFVKVKGTKSPYDGDAPYWIKRTKNTLYLNPRLNRLIRHQNGICPLCQKSFLITDEVAPEVDHVIPRSWGGSHNFFNLQAVHKDCHREKTNKELGPNKAR